MDEAYSAAYQPPPNAERAYREMAAAPKGTGWTMYAGTIIAIVGVVNAIYGLGAISRDEFFEQNASYIVADLKAWGWILFIVGVVQVCAALAIWSDRNWGRWVGVATASVNAIAQLMFLPAAPLAASAVFAADMLVLYGLMRYR